MQTLRFAEDRSKNRDRFDQEGIYTVAPRGILIIGSLDELGHDIRSRRETFERYRRSFHGIEILTFDELLARARFIVEDQEQSEQSGEAVEI